MSRLATLVFFVYVVLEGALRKWVWPGFSNELFVLKDIILVVAFLAWLTSRDSVRVALQPSEIWLWAAWLLVTIASAGLNGFGVESLVGLRYYLAPLPLLYVVSAMLRNIRDLNRLAVWYLWIALAIAALGAYQYASPVGSIINQYAWKSEVGETVASFGVNEDSLVAIAEDRPRITGSFSYISPYAVFLQAVWFIAWVTLLQATRRGERLFAIVALVAILANIAMTGSRAPLLLSLILAVPFAVMLLRMFTGFWLQFSVVVVLLVIPSLTVRLFFEPLQLLLERDDAAGDAQVRILGTFFAPLTTFDAMKALGEGVGSTFQGLQELGWVIRDSIFDEVFHDRVGIELGVLGYALALTIKVAMITKTFFLSLRAKTRIILYWAIAALCYQLSFVWQIPVYNSVAAIFYFSAIGLFYWLRAENEKVVPEVAGYTWSEPARAPVGRRS